MTDVWDAKLYNSPAMIEEARRLYPQLEFRLEDAHAFDVSESFDAIFSNAALLWIQEPAKVMACIARALKPEGRMAVEFGGHGNVGYFLVPSKQRANRYLAGPYRIHGTFLASPSSHRCLNNTAWK